MNDKDLIGKSLAPQAPGIQEKQSSSTPRKFLPFLPDACDILMKFALQLIIKAGSNYEDSPSGGNASCQKRKRRITIPRPLIVQTVAGMGTLARWRGTVLNATSPWAIRKPIEPDRLRKL